MIISHCQLLVLTKSILTLKFKMKDLGEAHSVLRIELIWKCTTSQLYLQMSGYSNEMLACFNMSNCKSTATPMVASLSLPCLKKTPPKATDLPYHSTTGRLLYLARVTCPNMLFAVHYLTHFINGYNVQHWQAVKHILHYLHGTCNLAILYNCHHYSPHELTSLLPQLSCNANFRPSNINNHKSLSAIEAHMCGGVITWFIKSQDCVALSTTKSKLNTISAAICQALYMQKLLQPLSITTNHPLSIINNNQSSITIITAHQSYYSSSKKHYNIKVKHTHDSIKAKQVTLTYCSTTKLPANIFTKALSHIHFNKLKGRLGLVILNNK